MPIDTNSTDWLYLRFRNSGPTPALFVPAILLNIVTNSGILLNLSVIIVTIRTKTLHGVSNYLVAMISLFEVVHQTVHLIFLIVALSGRNFIDFRSAGRFFLIPAIGMNGTMVAILCTGLDRLFAVLAPMVRKHQNKFLYLSAHTALSFGYGLYGSYFFYNVSELTPDRPTTGYVSDLLDGPQGLEFFIHTSVLNLAAALCYIGVGIVIKCKKVTQETNRRLLKSLACIVLINIGGYLINMSIMNLVYGLVDPIWYQSLPVWHVMFISGIALNIGAAANAPILYICSTDYRKAFKHHLAICRKYLRINNNSYSNNQQMNNITVVAPAGPSSSIGRNFVRNGNRVHNMDRISTMH